ncbi:MAG: 16S rRNA (cytosine(1402)-N(4))-methyltransferase RsmH [candidate division Zixibacteria bacterium]|nr:16S rRNA (cytosine(1402)-N(4))-methyltransferase RsmH [candidate division Zixibacteria bacterium]
MHMPVMAGETVKLLITNPHGAYLDLTVGTGAHLEAIALELESMARLYGLDKDKEAVELAYRRLDELSQSVQIECASYGDIVDVLESFKDKMFDGILMDLGLSSVQLDNPQRGFSFRVDGPLDMRFDPQRGGSTAEDILMSSSVQELTEIMRSYGEQPQAMRLARAIVKAREDEPIHTTSRLTDIIMRTISPPHQKKACMRVFMALRIAVNKELDLLSQTLPHLPDLMKIGGRLAVIAYHSLEDRIVKRFFQREIKGCICPPDFPKCVCGRLPLFAPITRRAVKADEFEIRENPRARSARLRVVERVAS